MQTRTGFSDWQWPGDLVGLPQLLRRLGIQGAGQLRSQDPGLLAWRLRQLNLQEGYMRQTPDALTLGRWIGSLAKPAPPPQQRREAVPAPRRWR